MNIKLISGFILGAVVGSLTTYLYMNKKYDDMMNEEYLRNKEYEENKSETVYEDSPEPVEVTTDQGVKSKEEVVIADMHKSGPRVHTNYGGHLKDDEWLKQYEEDKKMVEKEMGIYAITQKQFETEHTDDTNDPYDKITISYDPAADILYDENNEAVFGVESVIGYVDVAGTFETTTSNVMHIRNDELSIDFEVLKIADE